VSDQETFGGTEGEGRAPAVGTSTITFRDPNEPPIELIGFTYYETEEAVATWVWESGVVAENVTIPYDLIKRIDTRFEATGD